MKKVFLFCILLFVGIWVFLVGGYLGTPPTQIRTLIKVANPVILIGVAIFCKRREGLGKYYPVAVAFALSAGGLLLAWILRDIPGLLMGLELNSPKGWAVAKVLEALPMVLPAMVWLPIFGGGYSSASLKGGRLGLSLLLGLGMMCLVTLIYALTSDVGPKFASMAPHLGWLLLFSTANGFMEELLLRGLFLGKFEAFLSKTGALLLSTLIFTAMHFGASYLSSDNLLMLLLFIFLLGFGNGAIIQRSESIWGAVLAHSLADVLLLVSIFGSVS